MLVFTTVFGIHYNFFIVYLFDCNFVDLTSFSFLQGKFVPPKNRARLRGVARPSTPDQYRARTLSRPGSVQGMINKEVLDQFIYKPA